MKRPDDRLRAFAARVFNAPTMERVIDPAIADLRLEHDSWPCYVPVLKVMGLCLLGGSMRASESWSENERAVLRRALAVSLIALTVLTALVEWAPYRMGGQLGRVSPLQTVLMLLPFALSISVPMALTFGIGLGLGGRIVSRRLVKAAVLTSIACSLVLAVMARWIVPGFAAPVAVRTLEMTHAARWAVAFSPIALAMFMLSIVRWPSMRRWFAGTSALIAAVGYSGAGNFGRSLILAGDVPALVGAWLPNAMFVALALALMTLSVLRPAERPSPAAS
jgi:hypothetical protein